MTDAKPALNAILKNNRDRTSPTPCSIALDRLATPMMLFLWVSVAAFSAPTSLHARDNIALPAFQNNPESDRFLLREISDQLVVDTAPEPSNSRIQRATVIKRPPAQTAATVWEFVQQSTRLHIPEHERITAYRQQYQDEAIWISRILERASPFVGHIVEELDKRYLPVELALLPVIESGYRPDVHSSQDAAGIWQIVPGTASDIGLSHNNWFDGRTDLRQSTSAAVDYLSYLNAEFNGDWLLTLAAYNAGLGRVRTAIKRNLQQKLPTDFWSLKLPTETRNYVPKFLALVAMLRFDRPDDFTIPTVARGSAFDVVDTRKRVSLDRVAVITGIPEKHLQRLNAGLIHGITPPDGPHLLYLPQGFGKALVDKLATKNPQWLYTPPETHVVVSGDNLSSLARRYDIPQKRLMEINSLTSPMIRIGQKLTVLDGDNDKSNIEYVVTIGDTLSDIAYRFQIAVNDIRDESGERLKSDTIHPGETLSLLTGTQTGQSQ